MRPLAVLAAAAACTGFVWMASCSEVHPPEEGSEAATIYTANCAECHGVDGAGLKAASLRTGFSAAQVEAALTGGTGDHDDLQGRLSPEQVRTVAAYIERLGKSGDGP